MRTLHRNWWPVQRYPLLGGILWAVCSACGSGQSDSQDDTGAPVDTGAPPKDDTRIELIYVDSASDSLDATGKPGAVPEESTVPEAIPPAPSAADEAGGDDLLAFDADGDYAVQIGTFSESSRASRRVHELAALGYPAYAVAHPSARQFRVRIGYFSSRAEADRFGQRFQRDHGGKYWVDRRSSGDVAGK